MRADPKSQDNPEGLEEIPSVWLACHYPTKDLYWEGGNIFDTHPDDVPREARNPEYGPMPSALPMVFHSGGGLSYLQLPAFGYIAGFLPAAWLCGRLAQRDDVDQLENLMAIALLGVLTVQLCGGLNLVVGHWAGRWADPLPQLLLSYGLLPLGGQILLCAVVAVVSRLLRPLLTVNH